MLCFNSLQVRYKPFKAICYHLPLTCFNSLQVRYKPNPLSKSAPVTFLFQFLIGTLQTVEKVVDQWKKCLVSIPYRYATNSALHFFIERFHQFQFLIGTLQTQPSGGKEWVAEMFQFLIGTLQTLTEFFAEYHLNLVSIPYRYATNQALELCCLNRCNHVSIPYRYATNYALSCQPSKNEFAFQFLIGTLQTSFCCQPAPLFSGFNSLQVRYKQHLLMAVLQRRQKFQFLIGTLQTAFASFSPFPPGAVSIPYRYATNYIASSIRRRLKEFQFLIGTLQTVHPGSQSASQGVVSIPYRYATNGEFSLTHHDYDDQV